MIELSAVTEALLAVEELQSRSDASHEFGNGGAHVTDALLERAGRHNLDGIISLAEEPSISEYQASEHAGRATHL